MPTGAIIGLRGADEAAQDAAPDYFTGAPGASYSDM